MMKNRRQSALFVLVDKKKRLLLQHRDKYAPRCPEQWGLFGGGVEQGETPYQALHREVLEELGYCVDETVQLFKVNYYDEGSNYIFERHYYFSFLHREVPFCLGEGQGMGWFSFKEMTSLDLTSQITNVWLELKTAINKEYIKI